MEIKVVRQILEWNENCHNELRDLFDSKKVLVLNVMGSPGAGKTTFITNIITSLKDKYNIGVIEGDVAGKIDAEKIAEMGIPVVQLNTDGACHIEAMSIKNIIPEFDLDKLDVLIVENIGNLVCPAEFEIGEDKKIAVLSIPEGDDKIAKYPLMFEKADAVILNKYDLKQYFNYSEERVIEDAKKLNNEVNIFKVNGIKGEGINEVISWIEKNIKK